MKWLRPFRLCGLRSIFFIIAGDIFDVSLTIGILNFFIFLYCHRRLPTFESIRSNISFYACADIELVVDVNVKISSSPPSGTDQVDCPSSHVVSTDESHENETSPSNDVTGRRVTGRQWRHCHVIYWSQTDVIKIDRYIRGKSTQLVYTRCASPRR